MNNILNFLSKNWTLIVGLTEATYDSAHSFAKVFPNSGAAKVIDEVYPYVQDAINLLQPLVVKAQASTPAAK